ncbi:MAG TPA: ssDNA-binding protein [Rhodanobacter sp.]|nr:ssDNA-binding protein [Rhodanobacter sp.]
MTFLLPEGRVINEALFEKDAYVDPRTEKAGTPFYKIELAFAPEAVTGQGTIEDDLIEAACQEWGDSAEKEFLDGSIRSPFLDGDKLAKKRADKGKEGEAYKGTIVIRANTLFNLNGQDAPGGIQVYDENVKAIGPAQRAAIYPGMYGQCAVTILCYLDNGGDKAMKFYLSAFQKTKDGEKLIASSDHSSLFKPVGTPVVAAGEPATRSRRAR